MSDIAYSSINSCRLEALDIHGIAYRVYRWGDDSAPMIVMLHGWGDSGRTFQMLVDALLPGWQVVAPDWRGFGRSGWSANGYYFPDYLADLDRLLDHYSPRHPTAVVGHSMGGHIASLYAGSRPDRVAALANLEGFGLEDVDPDLAPERYGRWLSQQRDGQLAPATFGDYEQLAARIRGRHPGVSEAVALFAARQWARRIGDRVILRADPKHRWANPVLYREAETLACWHAITAEVLLVIGELSPFARSETSLANDDRVAGYQRASRIVLQNSGHMLHWECPAEVARHLRTFFQLKPTSLG